MNNGTTASPAPSSEQALALVQSTSLTRLVAAAVDGGRWHARGVRHVHVHGREGAPRSR